MRGDINVSSLRFIILDKAGCGNYLRKKSIGGRKGFSLRENVASFFEF